MIAILANEPERPRLIQALDGAPRPKMSTATYVEATIVADSRFEKVVSRRVDELMSTTGIELIPLTADQAHLARAAYRDFGRGSGSPARLNLGDCFSYALAKDLDEPLLFVGADFTHTDVRSALT